MRDLIFCTDSQWQHIIAAVGSQHSNVVPLPHYDFVNAGDDAQTADDVDRRQWVSYDYDYNTRILTVGFTGHNHFTAKIHDAEDYELLSDDFRDPKAKQYLYMLIPMQQGTMQVWRSFVSMFCTIQDFIAQYDPSAFDVQEKQVTRRSGPASGHRRQDRRVRMFRTYTLRRDWQPASRKGGKHIISCPSWGVRGHWRHYKSGKTIFVRAFTKGKQRDQYSAKQYQLTK